MPRTYAYVVDGVVREIIQAAVDEAGIEISIEDRFTPDFVESLIDITDVVPTPDQRWTYTGGVFAAPVQYQPSAVEILATNTLQRDAFLSVAAINIAPLQDAVDLGIATDDETALLKQWKQYRVSVNRIDLSQGDPTWPALPTAS